MQKVTDIVVFGTGAFAARILFDLAATAETATRVVVAGRDAARLAWLETAARARAHMFVRDVTIATATVDLLDHAATADLLSRLRPAVVLQAASLQSASVIAARGNAWSQIVAEGGLSASAVFQAVLTARVARACVEASPGTRLVNACFPDVVNSIVAAMELPITCGIGNIQILAHAFGGSLPDHARPSLRLLAHYQNLAAWRRLPADRSGLNARVWIDGVESDDIYARFRAVLLTPEPVIDVSGAAAAPLLVALAHGKDWDGHVPGPEGLPGGYPVHVSGGALRLDLPAGISREAAVAWNLAHEASGGLIVEGQQARYTGRLHDRLAAVSPELARGFTVRDLESVHIEMQALRSRLQAQVA